MFNILLVSLCFIRLYDHGVLCVMLDYVLNICPFLTLTYKTGLILQFSQTIFVPSTYLCPQSLAGKDPLEQLTQEPLTIGSA
jgi:hypothetical protein